MTMDRATEQWRNDAACAGVVDPLWDYHLDPKEAESDGMRARRLHAAKRICNHCPVIVPCVEYALDRKGTGEVSGLWGGMLFNGASNLEALPRKPVYVPEHEMIIDSGMSMSTSKSKQTVALEASRDHHRIDQPVRPRRDQPDAGRRHLHAGEGDQP